MKTIHMRAGAAGREFTEMAALFATQGDELTTEAEIVKALETEGERIVHKVALDESAELLGFYWLYHSKMAAGRYYVNLIVKPEWRRQGVGSQLYADLEQALEGSQANALRVDVKDTCPECLAFAEKRGFHERAHQIEMSLDLARFDDRAYDGLVARLEGEGFLFTSMEALGNSEEMQRRLFELNLTTAMETMGTDGEPSWKDFADFQASVCQAEWFKPGGQMVVIDSASGAWVAMSAITRFAGTEHAYNLFTGVQREYRGRKLGLAVKVVALSYAREVLGVTEVRTHHNTKNQPILAIDGELGYVLLPGTYAMQKVL